MNCPRRSEAPYQITEPPDSWDNQDGTCSYCGSISPAEMFRRVEAGVKVEPTDKNYKIYIGQNKFYLQHLTVEERHKFIKLYNDKVMQMAYPGYFYRLPFFMKVIKKEDA